MRKTLWPPDSKNHERSLLKTRAMRARLRRVGTTRPVSSWERKLAERPVRRPSSTRPMERLRRRRLMRWPSCAAERRASAAVGSMESVSTGWVGCVECAKRGSTAISGDSAAVSGAIGQGLHPGVAFSPSIGCKSRERGGSLGDECLGIEGLLEGEEWLPWVGTELVAPRVEVGDAKDGAVGQLEGIPWKRQRDGAADSRAGRVRCDSSSAAFVAEVVEVDLSGACGLGHLGDIERGVGALHSEDEVVGGFFDGEPIVFGCDGRNDVKALAAGGLEEAFEAGTLEALTDVSSRGAEGKSRQGLVGV